MSDKDTYNPLALAFGTFVTFLLSGPIGEFWGEMFSIPDFVGSVFFILICVLFIGASMIKE